MTSLPNNNISSTSTPTVLNTLPEHNTSSSFPPRTNEGLRICQVIGVKPEVLKEYEEIHAAVWPSVLSALRRANVVDYSIHHVVLPLAQATSASESQQLESTHLLIANMRYNGEPANFKADMKKIGEDPETHRWWKLTDPMQNSFIPNAEGSASGPGWWMNGREVFRFEG